MSSTSRNAWRKAANMGPKEKELPENVKAVLRQFASSTSAHGLSHIANSKYSYQKLLWAFVLLLNLFMFFFMISRLIVLFAAKPTATKVEYTYEKEMPFPAVTICNQNMFRLSRLTPEDHSVFRPSGGQVSTESATTLSTRFQEELERQGHTEPEKTSPNSTEESKDKITVDRSYVLRGKILEKVNLMDVEIKRSKGHSFEDFIKYCRWDGMACHKGFFQKYWYQKWDWKYGNCFTFNYGRTQNGSTLPKLKATGSGSENGLFLEIDIQEMEYFPELSIESGVRVLLTEQEINVYPNEEGFSIPAGVSAILSVRMATVKRADPFNNGSCKVNMKEDSGFRYTVQNCIQNCSAMAQEKQCNCSSLKYAGVNSTMRTCHTDTEKTCAFHVSKALKNGTIDCKAKCPQPCSETSFSKSMSYSKLYSKGYLKDIGLRETNVPQEKHVKENYIRILIYFEDQNVHGIKTEVYYEVENLLSDIGGQLGLWIGVSMVTMVEFVIFVYKFGEYIMEKKKNKSKIIAVQS